MSFFSRLASQTGFGRFLDFVSPALFDVMPFGAMARAAMSLVADYRDKAAFLRLVKKEAGQLDQADIGVVLSLDAPDHGPLDALDRAQKIAAGEAVLALYFQQLVDPGAALLDLSPGRGHVHWDEDFRAAIANVYRSYYESGEYETLEAIGEPLDVRSAFFRVRNRAVASPPSVSDGLAES